jgi:DNA-binding transcriptional ArsR family regulator
MMTMDKQPDVREIDSVEELRTLADPVRLAILAALDPQGPDAELPVMSVKELAQRLAEPQTKLYRHVKQLEAAGLIHVAATRVVSGIVEQRYQASQRSVRLSPGLISQHADEAVAAVRSVFDTFLAGLADQVRNESPAKPILYVGDCRVTPEAAERIRARLADLIDEISRAEAGDVPINVAIGFYRLG